MRFTSLFLALSMVGILTAAEELSWITFKVLSGGRPLAGVCIYVGDGLDLVTGATGEDLVKGKGMYTNGLTSDDGTCTVLVPVQKDSPHKVIFWREGYTPQINSAAGLSKPAPVTLVQGSGHRSVKFDKNIQPYFSTRAAPSSGNPLEE